MLCERNLECKVSDGGDDVAGEILKYGFGCLWSENGPFGRCV